MATTAKIVTGAPHYPAPEPHSRAKIEHGNRAASSAARRSVFELR